MKTKEQIIDYIDNQPWKNAFYKNVFKFGYTPCAFDAYLIYSSFDWSRTEEGPSFWGDIHRKYERWYRSELHAVTSWKEYCEKVPGIGEYYYYSEDGNLTKAIDNPRAYKDPIEDVNVMPKELCEAFHAYMKLVQLKAYWDKDYNYSESNTLRYKLVFNSKDGISFIPIVFDKSPATGFVFLNKTYASKFYETFKDLFEIAKPIL